MKRRYSKFDSSSSSDESDAEETSEKKLSRSFYEDEETVTSIRAKAAEIKSPMAQLPIYCPALMGCRSVDEYYTLNRIEEGAYGVVFRAKDKRTDEIVALKRFKLDKEREGFPIMSLREINTLLRAGDHPNIVKVREVVTGGDINVYLVMDYVEHDLKSLLEEMDHPFLIGEVKTLLKQLFAGVKHLHENWILHRDLKTANLLLSHQGILKIADFGLARQYGSPLKAYTPGVVTLWYRAPELLLDAKEYSTPIDIWSVACIFTELLKSQPLFMGFSEMEQIKRIFTVLGTPNETIWPGFSKLPMVERVQMPRMKYTHLQKYFDDRLSDIGLELLSRCLTYDPKRRMSAAEALESDWFKEEPRPIRPELFPSWPAKSEMSGAREKKMPKDPQDDSDTGYLTNPIRRGGIRKRPDIPGGFTLKFDAPKFS